MCYYCDNEKEPIRKPVIPKDIDFHQMFEHPPVNYARYGLYPRDIRPVNLVKNKTELTWICPMCGTNIYIRERNKLKDILHKYSPIPRQYVSAIKLYNLEKEIV